jgi:hypothetical protein
MPNPNTPGAAVPRLAPLSFYSCNTEQTPLFSVNAGVPLLDALQEASNFLAGARAAAYSADEEGTGMAYSAAYLIHMAKAVIDAAIAGLDEGKQS